MSVHVIYYQDGAKHMRPISSAEEYHKLRASAKQTETLKAARTGDKQAKRSLLQFNYSCLPNDDGTLKGSVRMSSSVGMDIDQEVDVACILNKKDELGLLMLERSVSKGYHLVFKRHTDMTQEQNLRWASDLLGIPFDEAAKDHTRVFFTTSDSPEDLLFLSEELFDNTETTPFCPTGIFPREGARGWRSMGILLFNFQLFHPPFAFRLPPYGGGRGERPLLYNFPLS